MRDKTITLKEIYQAQGRIKDYIRHTPLEWSEYFSRLYESDIYLKLENLQVTGSFKPRGSFNRLLTLDEKERERGVIAPSAGNHGIGLAYAAGQLNIPSYVYLPKDADRSKEETLENYGASITFYDSIEEARVSALKDAQEKGYTFLSAYNDPSMIAGGGTVGLEILEDLKDVEIVITCLGGGGLSAGVCLALKSVNPNIMVWGVQTKNSPTFAVWHKNGEASIVDIKPSIAEGLSGTIEPETITFPIIHEQIDRVLTVSEEEVITAMRTMVNFQYIVEPSGAAGIACLNQMASEIKGRKVAVIVTGKNIAWDRFLSLIEERTL